MDESWTWLLLWLLVFVLGGCGIRESAQAPSPAAPQDPLSGQALSFTTVAQDSVIGSYRKAATPKIFVVANAQDVQDIARQILEDAPQAPRMAEQLGQVDFERSFAIMVTPGKTAPGVYGITVQQVTRQGDLVTVQAKRDSWKPGELHPAYDPDPAHIVAVTKEGAWDSQIRFEFVVDGSPAAETTHFIP